MFRSFDDAVSQGEGKSIFHWKFLSARCSDLRCGVLGGEVVRGPESGARSDSVFMAQMAMDRYQAELSQFWGDEHLFTSYFDVHLGPELQEMCRSLTNPQKKNPCLHSTCIPCLTMPELKGIRPSSVFQFSV